MVTHCDQMGVVAAGEVMEDPGSRSHFELYLILRPCRVYIGNDRFSTARAIPCERGIWLDSELVLKPTDDC